jgi:hypothetical protein
LTPIDIVFPSSSKKRSAWRSIVLVDEEEAETADCAGAEVGGNGGIGNEVVKEAGTGIGAGAGAAECVEADVDVGEPKLEIEDIEEAVQSLVGGGY